MKYVTTSLIVLGAIVIITFITAGCSSRSGDIASAPIEASIPGVVLWSNNCMKCHNLRPQTEFNDAQWGLISTHMRVRANLTGTETRQILDFLQSSN